MVDLGKKIKDFVTNQEMISENGARKPGIERVIDDIKFFGGGVVRSLDRISWMILHLVDSDLKTWCKP